MLTTRSKIALARLCQKPLLGLRRMFGAGSAAEVRRNGLRWRLDLDEGIDFSIFLLGAFEAATVAACERLVRAGDVVLDIGANIGAHTLPLARLVGPTGRVVAFEPTDFAFAKLSANLALNPVYAARVTVAQTMLLDRGDGPIPRTLPSSWPLAGGADVHPKLRGRDMTTAGAGALTLDTYLAENAIRRVDFIKLDVDGFECRVLTGAEATLRRCRPVIVMELSPYILDERGDSLDRLLDILETARYELADLSSEAPLPRGRDILRRMIPDGAGRNIIARPNPRASGE
ncbi:MAG: FkbM family methyltransferase [Rhodospirillaceae bacterium]|nr:FkbM family methyltransferase [Rhodospirillaceae bacterium]